MKIGTEKSLIPTFYTSFLEFAHLCEFSYEHWKEDLSYILNRYEKEGNRFVSQTLPLLGRAVEYSLISLNKLEVPKGFGLIGSFRLPKLFGSILKYGFDQQGWPLYDIRDKGNQLAEQFGFPLYVVLQSCLAFSKVQDVECLEKPDDAIAKAITRFRNKPNIRCDGKILGRASRLIHNIFYDDEARLHPSLTQWEEIPFGRHGPGAVCGRERGSQKWSFEAVDGLPLDLFSWRSGILSFDKKGYGYSRITTVPKDFTKLRTIAIESKEMQFGQQGLMHVLYDILSSHSLTRRAISFKDQSKNCSLARDYDFSTIDLKDASDMVSKDLCRILLGKKLFSLLSRFSSRGLLHKGEVVHLNCMATMGSAICFPIETLVFWALARASCESVGIAPNIRVFGDDIIVPRGAFGITIRTLEQCGFTPNLRKSCDQTLIRESCGSYYWAGVDIRTVKFDSTGCAGPRPWISLYSQIPSFLEWGNEGTASSIRSLLNDALGSIGPVRRRWSKTLQRIEVKMPILCGGKAGGALPGYTGMYAWIVGNDTHPSSRGTLEKVKWKWVLEGPLRLN